MRTVFMMTLMVMGLIACNDSEHVCVDVIDEGDGRGLDEDFLGVEACCCVFADGTRCKDEGARPL